MDTTRDYGLIRQPHPITRVAVANAAPATISATSRAAAIELSWMPAWARSGWSRRGSRGVDLGERAPRLMQAMGGIEDPAEQCERGDDQVGDERVLAERLCPHASDHARAENGSRRRSAVVIAIA